MPIDVKCSNPACGTSYTLVDELAGKKIKCRQCGAVIPVPDAMSDDIGMTLESGMPVGGEGGDGSMTYHPARQECPKCGKILGVAAITCPHCGADVRTGELTETKQAKKSINLKPILKGAVAVLLIGVVGYLLWSNREKIKGLFSRKAEESAKVEKEEVKKEAVAAPKQVIKIADMDKKKLEIKPDKEDVKELKIEAPKLTEAEAAALKPEEAKIVADVKSFWDDETKAFNQIKPELWAELYQKCKKDGLAAEAQRCWAQAVRLQPKSGPVNQILGRVETSTGEYATPLQVKYLDRFKPSLVLRNQAFDSLSVALGDEPARKLATGQDVTFIGPAGAKTVTLKTEGRESGEGKLTLSLPSAVKTEVELIADDNLPTLPSLPFDTFKKALDKWERDKKHSESVREKRGWRHAEGNVWSFDYKVSSSRGAETRTLKYLIGGNSEVKALEAEGAQLVATLTVPAPRVDRQIRVLVIHGAVIMDNGKTQIFSEKVGDQDNPIRVLISAYPNRPATLLSGKLVKDGKTLTLYRGTLTPPEGRRPVEFSYSQAGAVPAEVWNVVALEYPDTFTQRSNDTLHQAEEGYAEAVKAEEALGKVCGPLQRDDWIDKKMVPLRQEVAFRRALLDKARQVPPYRDRVAEVKLVPQFKDIDPVSWQFLNWRQFSRALGKALDGSTQQMIRSRMAAIREQTQSANRTGGQPAAPSPNWGGPGGMDMGGFGPAPSQGGRPGGQDSPEKSVLDLLAFLRVAPENAFLPLLTTLESSPSKTVRSAVIDAYESIGHTQAAERLAKIAKSNEDVELRVKCLLALGRIGQDYALKYCREVYVQPATRAASLAALVLAGDRNALQRLPEEYSKSNIESQKLLFAHLLDRDSIAQVLALRQLREKITDARQSDQIAVALAEHGGIVSVHTLGEMIKNDGRLYIDALRIVSPKQTTPLIRPLTTILRGQSEEKYAAAIFLGQSHNPLAKDHLLLSAQNDHQACGALGLALLGSADALKAATDQIERLDFNSMKVLRRLWQKDGQLHAKWEWRDGVDNQAAAQFLNNVVFKSELARVQLAAAFILAEIGITPDRQALVKLANLPLENYGADAGTGTDPNMGGPGGPLPPPQPQGPGQKGGKAEPAPELPKRIGLPDKLVDGSAIYQFIGPGAAEKKVGQPGQPGQPGYGQPGYGPEGYGPEYGPGYGPDAFDGPNRSGKSTGPVTDQKLPFGQKLDFGDDPRLVALKLLDRIADTSVTPDLQRLALTGPTVDLRTQAMWTLGKLANQQAIETLINIFAVPPDQFPSLEGMNDSARVRAGAAHALGQAGYFKVISKLIESLKKEQAPAALAIGRAEERQDIDKYNKEAARWKAILIRGVCEALGDLCAYRPGYTPKGVTKEEYEKARTWAALTLVDQAAYPGKGYKEVEAEERAARLAAVIALGKIRGSQQSIINLLRQLTDPKIARSVAPEMRRAALLALINTGGRETGDIVGKMIPELMKDKDVKQLILDEVPKMVKRGSDSDMMLLNTLLPYLDRNQLRFVAEALLAFDTRSLQPNARMPFLNQRASIFFAIVQDSGKGGQYRSDQRQQNGTYVSSINQEQLDWYRLRRRCIEELAKHTTNDTLAMLRKLTEHPDFAIEAMLLLGKRDEDYQMGLADRLHTIAGTDRDMARRRGAAAALRRLDTERAYAKLNDLFLGRKIDAPKGGPDQYGPGGPQENSPFSKADEITLLAARCLATAGRVKDLSKAFQTTRRGRKVYDNYPKSVQHAAIYGFAWLPLDKEPLEYLERKLRIERDDNLRRAMTESIEILKQRALEEKPRPAKAAADGKKAP